MQMLTHELSLCDMPRLASTPLPVAPCLSGLGIALPQSEVASEEIDHRIGRPPGWLEARCGVARRYVAAPGETQEALGAAAARRALADAGLVIEDIDLLLFGASVGRQPIPATAPLIKRELAADALTFPAYDVNATCLSALVAADVAALHIAAGRARHVLVVTSEIASRALPWRDAPETAGLFSDGAAAIILSAPGARKAGPLGRLTHFRMETFAQGYEACQLPAGGTRLDYHADPDTFGRSAWFQMDGRALYRLTAAALPGFLDRFLDTVGLRRQDIDLVIPHQASPHALAHIIRRGGFKPGLVFDRVRLIGNQVAASLPIALELARQEGRISAKQRILLIGTSAGVSLGAALLET
ncbi:3-oxoacyl-ACP synthase III family protein [Hyphomonas sp.]|uniref:3-oxoacyl-ACP synthase III family protein n=1 Tax=Hyphomonas sp. TaxID=87 RepID=UPI0039194BA7